jgi:class 3 adenylate cyclase/tetratricopeptide (TPR) repeat protein
LEGERKHVTVLFADLQGFTTLSEARDPEEVHGLMDRFFQLVLEEVHRHEGTVNQFLGDGVMALFGAPLALEDAPRRAVRAALGIQRGLGSLRGADGVATPLPLRIGIHSGLVVVGRIGDDLRMDYTAVGDTTNLANRLQGLAGPGEILVSDATRRLAAGYFDFEDLGEREVRGRSEPVRAFRVLEERAVDGRIEAASGGLTPLVGRETELAAVRAAFGAARNGRGQACFLAGDAGIGKSRLLYEFRRALADEPHRWFEGHCEPYGRSSGFQAIANGLRRFFAIDDRDDDLAATTKLAHGVRALGEDLAWTLPLLEGLLALPVSDETIAALDPVPRRNETIRALQALFRSVAQQEPLVFVIEDLHWIDAASEEFLGLLIDSIPAARMCLLLTHRPGYRHPFGDRSYHVRVALQPLSSVEMAAMAGSLLESAALPAELRDLIVKKAEGNPFFVEEVTKSLLEEGVLHVVDGRVELARSVEGVSIPDTIQDVLMARIDRLDEAPKRALQIASVIGREFALRLLERISEAGDAVRELVGELRTLELIYEKAAHPELAFMFKHALTHDVAYESVLIQRRKQLHRIVGAAIGELYKDRLTEHYEALAHHFECGEDWERALAYHERAAAKAASAYANDAAAEHCKRALAIAERLGAAVPDERRRRLALSLGEAQLCVNDRNAAEAFARAAEWSSDPGDRAHAFALAAYASFFAHDYARIGEYGARAAEVGRVAGATRAVALARLVEETQVLVLQGPAEFDEPERAFSETCAIASRCEDPGVIGACLNEAALCREMCGDYQGAIDLAERALATGGSESLVLSIAGPRWILGKALTCLGDYARAVVLLQGASEIASRIGDRVLTSRILNTLGWCYAEFGCDRRASECNRQAVEIASDLMQAGRFVKAPEIHINAAVNLAGNHLALGAREAADEVMAALRATVERTTDPFARWRYMLHVADVFARAALSRGDPDRALALADDELAGARRQHARKLQARALELRGRALLTMDQREEASQSLGEALRIAKEIGYPPVTWRALSLLAESARRAGEAGDAERLAREARDLVERLARTLPQPELSRELRGLGERLVTDPLGAYR